MKIITFIFKNLCIWMVFLVTIYTQSMQLPDQELARQDKVHYQNQLIALLPDEICIHMLSYRDMPEDEKDYTLTTTLIQECLELKTTCKQFNRILTIITIGEMYKKCSTASKNTTLEKITRGIVSTNYDKKRYWILLLLQSGASADAGMHMKYTSYMETRPSDFSLLHKVLIQKDNELLELLFKHGANPNQIHPDQGPLFFLVSTIDVLELFFKYKVDLNSKDNKGNNVLWYVHKLSLEFIQFYIKHGIDTRYINPSDNTCILHALANPSFKNLNNSHDFFKKGVLLIKENPGMVSALDRNNKTPVDLMNKKTEMEFYKNNKYYARPLRNLIDFCRTYSG